MSNPESIVPSHDGEMDVSLSPEESRAWMKAFYDGWCLRSLTLAVSNRIEGYDPDFAAQRLFESTMGDTSRRTAKCFNAVCPVAYTPIESLLESAPNGCSVYIEEEQTSITSQ